MEPEDLPWPGELEEEEEEEEVENASPAATEETGEARTSEETVKVEEIEFEEAGPEVDLDFNCESQTRESTDEEEDEMAKAWLLAHPGQSGRAFPPPPPPRYLYAPVEHLRETEVVSLTCHGWQQSSYQDNSRAQLSNSGVVSLETTVQWGPGEEQRAESWHHLPQERDSSQTLDTPQAEIDVRIEGMKVIDFPSLEKSELTQSERPVMKPKLNLLCSPLLVIQDNFATPDLPLLTCLTQDQEFEPDSLLQQSELEFAPLREIPDKSEDTEWLSRPSEVSEALFQATSETSSDLVNSCLSISQHPLTGSTTFGSQRSLFPSEQENNGENAPPNAPDELKGPNDSDHYDALLSYMSWQTEKDTQQPEGKLTDKDQVSTSTFSDVSDESITARRNNDFGSACSHAQYWKQETPQQSEACLPSTDQASFPCEITPPNKMSYSFPRCMLERGKGAPLTSVNHLENVCLRSPSEDKMNPKMDSLEGFEGNEDMKKKLPPFFKQKEIRNILPSPQVHAKSPEIKYLGLAAVLDSHEQVSEAHILSRGLEISKLEASGGPLRTVKANLDETSEQLYFQEERNQKAASTFDGLQEKAESTIVTLHGDAEYCSLYKTTDVHSERVSELQREVDHSNLDISQPFPSPLSSFVPQEPTSESKYHSPNLRMLRVSLDTQSTALTRSTGDTSKGGKVAITQSKLKPDITNTLGDSDIGTHSPLSLEDLSQFAVVPEGRLSEEAPQASAHLGLVTPSIGKSPAIPTSCSQREKPGIFYQQTLTGGHLPEEIMKTSAAPRPTDQKFDSPASLPTSYTYEGPNVFYQQMPKSHLSEETVRGSALPGSATQNVGITVPSFPSLSHGEKSHTFYYQALPESYLSHQPWKVSVAPGPIDQKTGAAVGPSTDRYFTVDQKTGAAVGPSTDRYFTEETWKVSSAPRSAGQKLEMSTAHSSPYSKGIKPAIFYQYPLLESHPGKEPLNGSAVSGSAQKTQSPTATSASQPHKEIAKAFYQQTLSNSHLTEEALPISVIPGRGDQKTPLLSELPFSYSHRAKNLPEGVKVSTDSGSTDIPTVSSSSYQHKKKPTVPYHQELPDSHVPAGTQKVSFVSGPVDQKSGISHPYVEIPCVFYQQELPGSHSTEKSTKTLILRPAVQKTDLSTVSPASPSLAEKPVLPYQPTPPGSQLSGISTITSASYSYKERPNISQQQKFPDSYLSEEARKVLSTTGSVDQKTGTPTMSLPSIYSQKEGLGIFYQQVLPDPLYKGALQTSATTSTVDQSIAMPTVSCTSFLQREQPQIFYQQAPPGGHLPGESLKVSSAPGPPDQNTGAPAVSPSSYFPREESIIFHQPGLSGNPLSAECFKVPGISGVTEQKTSTPAGPSGSYPVREKSIIFYQQTLPDAHFSKEALDVLTSSGPADLKTGAPPVYSTPYSFGEKPIIFYQQALSDDQLTKKDSKVSVVSGPADQKAGLPLTISSYSNLENTVVSYHQELPDRPLTENAGKVSVVPGPTDQKTGISTVPSTSHSKIERPTSSYQQEFPDLTEKALEVLGGTEPIEQKTEIQAVSSTPFYRETPSVSYQQDLPDLTEEALQILADPGVVPSIPYSKDATPLISYQQESPDLTEKSLKAVGPGSTDQKTRAQKVSYLSREQPSDFQQELPNTGEDALGGFVHPGPFVQKVGKTTEPSNLKQREANVFSPQELPVSHLTEEGLKVSAGSTLKAQTPGAPTGPSSSYLHREKLKASPDHVLTENSLKASTVPGLSDQNRRPTVSSGSYSHKEKHKISAADLRDDKKVELPTVTHKSYLHREKPAVSSVIGPDDQKTPLPTAFHGSCPQKVKPAICVQKQLTDRDQSEDIPKISTVLEPTVVSTGVPVPLPGSYSHREKLDTSCGYPQELPDRHLTEDALKVSSCLGQADQISDLPTASPGTYSHSEKHQLVSEHAQKLIDDLNSSESCSLIANSMPLNSQIDDGLIICKPESSGFGDVVCEEIRDIDHGSKTLKEIQTLLMEAENIALKRCNFPSPLIPFRDVNDVSLIQSKKMVCFRDPSTTDVYAQREPLPEEIPHIECVQKDIGTQTNFRGHRGVENWKFIRSTTIRSPLQEAEGPRVAFDGTFRQMEASGSVLRSEPEGCSTSIGNKILIPMMTFIRSDSSSDVSDGCCSWDSNLPESLESVSDVFLNFFPYTSPKTSITDSREEEGLSESEDGCGSVDSLAAHVKYLLQCESSLNQAKQILKKAEEEECRVRAQAWNLKFNLGHDYGYSISELNEDDRRKVEEIKAKLFGHGRATRISEGLQSPRGIGCVPEAVCNHIVIESHEKGCFRTLTAERPRPDSCHGVSRSVEPSDLIRGQRSPSSRRAQPVLLPYKPSGSSEMYYVPQLKAVPSDPDTKSDTTVESSHSGSNDAVAPDFPPQVLGTRDDDLSATVNIKHTEGIYSKRAATTTGKKPPRKDNAEAPVQVPVIGDQNVSDGKQKEIISRRVVTKMTWPEERSSLQDTAGSSDTIVQDRKTEKLSNTKSIIQKEEIHVKRTIPQELCPEKEGSLEIDISESQCRSAFENTTHSVFRSAKFYFHHPVHLPHEQDFCPESLGRSVFMQHSWKDFFHHHSEHSCLPPPGTSADKTKMDYTRIKSLSINLNLGDNEKTNTVKNQAGDPKGKRQTNDPKKDQKVTPELAAQCTVSLNELWNKYQERQKQQKPPAVCEKKELSLVERLDRLAKLLQNPITHSLQASESTQDESRGGRGVRGWTGRRRHQLKGKLQRKQRKSLERGHSGKSNQIKIEQVKLDKYILRKRPDFNYVSNTSSDSRPSDESELLTDSPNIFSSTTSPMDSDVLTQTDRDVTLNDRSSSISTIDTARLIQAFGHEKLCLSPRRMKLYSSVTNQQRRFLEKRYKHSKKALSTGYPQMTSEYTRRRHIQVANQISSDSGSSAGSFLSLTSTLYDEESVHMLNKGVQAGNLEIVTGVKKYTRDVGVIFPTPSPSEPRLEEDSDVTSWSEEKAKEKKFLTSYLRDKNLRKNKPNFCEGVSWFVPVENRKSGSKKENLPKIYGPGISWFEPVTKTKPWREPLREQNRQEQCVNSRGSLGGPGGDGGRAAFRPFVRATLQESLQLHRPDFISRSGERIKRLKLLVQERKLQSLFQSEREVLFNAVRPLPRRALLTAQKNKPIGKKEMIQRTKRIYEQLPEVKKKREEEKRKSEYKSYRLRAQHYKTKVTNQLLGRKVPWD
uniref:Alstrom syndrome protein 1 isoform X5 n=1 Tax=Myodes glareolus TaxID=447135 RepID=UPI00201FCABF|nr:Alstrom syndrome protein 1 isoform X5 [Myodes glareolus]